MSNQVFIPVFDDDGDDPESVDARDLWQMVGSRQKFTDWFELRVKQTRAVEGKDFWIDFVNVGNQSTGRGGDRRSQRRRITTDMAKHWAMLEATDQGYAIRDYFIERDKKLKAVGPLLQALLKRIQAIEERAPMIQLGSDGASLDGKSLTDLVMALRASQGGHESIPEFLRLYLSAFVRGRIVAEDIQERTRKGGLREAEPGRFVTAMVAVLRDLRYGGCGGGALAGIDLPGDVRKSAPAFEQWYTHERDRPWVEKAWTKVVNSLPRVVRGGDRQRALPGMEGGDANQKPTG